MYSLLNTFTYGFINILSATPSFSEFLTSPINAVRDLLYNQIAKIVSGAIGIIYYLTALSINLMSSASSVRLDASKITSAWDQSIFYVNVIAVFVLIAIALANALRLNIETYEIKKTLPGLIAGFILANLSLLLCRAVLDLSDIITYQIASNNNDGGNLAASLISTMTGVAIKAGGKVDLGDSAIQTILKNFSTFFLFSPQSIALNAAVGITILIMACIWFSIPAVLIAIIALLMIIRYLILMVLVVIAPIAIIFYFFPPTKNLGQRWFDEFFKWAFLPPIVFFILRLSTFFAKNSTDKPIAYIPLQLPATREIQTALHSFPPSAAKLFVIEHAYAIVVDDGSSTATNTAANSATTGANTGNTSNTTAGKAEISAGSDLWANILSYIAGIGIMIAAIFVPFQIGGLGGQLMNWVSNLGKGLAGGVGRAGVKALDDRFQIGERTKGAWAKTPFGKYQQRAALGKELVKSNTDAANKETQEEFLFKRLKHFEETKTNNSNNPEYVATLRKYRAIASERNAPFEKLSFDQKAALVEKFDRDHKGDIQKIVNGKTPTSANFKEAGDLRALLAEIDKDRNSFDPNTRAKQQQFENKYYPNSNRDFYGNLKPNNMEPDQAVIQAIKENYADKTTEQKQLIRDFSSGKLNNIPQTVITRAEELSGFKPDPKKPDQHLSLDEVYHNKFTARVQNKTENILASHDKSRYNNNVLQNMKTYIDNNDFQGASSYARRHNMHGLLPELKTLQPHSIEHATLSRSLDEMINANKAVTTNRTTSMDQMRADIEVKLDAINKDPSLTKNNSYDPVQLTLQQDIIKRFDQQMNYINTNSSYETYNQSIGNTYNNSKKAESVKQIIKDFQDPSKYSKAYIEDLLPEIDTNRRNEISSNVEAMGAEYQNILAERIHKIYQKNPPKNPSTKQPSQPPVTPVGQVHTAGGTKDVEDFEIGTHTEPTA